MGDASGLGRAPPGSDGGNKRTFQLRGNEIIARLTTEYQRLAP